MNAAFQVSNGLVKSPIKILKSCFPILNLCNHNHTLVTVEAAESPSKQDSSFLALKISHPWLEWVSLMEVMSKQGYFDGDGNPFGNEVLGPKESNSIRTACLNFARDRYHIMRYFSSKNIRVIAECGCPSTDRKVVNSGKRLRAHLNIDEGNVCSSCNLRGNCERAFVMAREDQGGRTVDVMRLLLTYGLDTDFGTVENKPCLNNSVKDSVRALLQQMVDYSNDLPESETSKPTRGDALYSEQMDKSRSGSMKQGDWLCPKCNFINFSRNIKCLRCDNFSEEKLKQLKEENEHLPLKKGDWICEKCNFLNFSKNSCCLVCKEKPPKRELNPGEWECDSCNYINFRRNSICLKCDHKRPKALNTADTSSPPPPRQQDRVMESSNYQSSLRRSGNRAWRFVEEEVEVHDKVDFPIIGGKSDISRDPQRREEWKMKMLQRKPSADEREVNGGGGFHPLRSRIKKEVEFDDGFRPLRSRIKKEVEFDGDEEMDEWFDQPKM